MRILLVDDEIKMAALLKRGLQEEGYAVDVAGTAEDAVWMGSENPYDAIVLDVMLPDGSGFDVCKQLRKAKQWAPVIMLTARDAVADRIAGLDGGADDYLTKPFSFAELLARMRALLRRGTVERVTVLRAGPLEMDPAARKVDGRRIAGRADDARVRAPRIFHAAPGRGAEPHTNPRARLGFLVRRRLQRGGCLCTQRLRALGR